jgi:stage II sporulation protein D
MKIIISASVLMVIVVFILPFFTVKGGLMERELMPAAEETQEPTPPPRVTPDATPSPSGPPLFYGSQTDKTTQVRLLTKGSVKTLTMHNYLVGVVAAEMPASFEPEALKAQAVAARTYTYYKMVNDSNHDNADVCDDCNCCKAYLSSEDLKSRWADKYDFNMEIITSAVTETDGLLVTYERAPILAAFHSSSSGYTEDSENVWQTPLPYLVSVESPEGETCVPNYCSEINVSFDEFKRMVKADYPDAVFEGEPDSWIADVIYSDSGRIISVAVGGAEMTGTNLRRLFGLRSAAVVWTIGESGFMFKATGYGHGVGMSQYGANEFAKQGAVFSDILTYYYKGTEVHSIQTVQSDQNQV